MNVVLDAFLNFVFALKMHWKCTGNELEMHWKENYWINKIGVSRGAIRIYCQLNIICKWIILKIENKNTTTKCIHWITQCSIDKVQEWHPETTEFVHSTNFCFVYSIEFLVYSTSHRLSGLLATRPAVYLTAFFFNILWYDETLSFPGFYFKIFIV